MYRHGVTKMAIYEHTLNHNLIKNVKQKPANKRFFTHRVFFVLCISMSETFDHKVLKMYESNPQIRGEKMV